MRTYRVTQEHIDNGVRDNCFECPVALAILTTTTEVVDVERSHIAIGERCYPMPETARRFVAAFDLGEPVEPFSFSLEVE